MALRRKVPSFTLLIRATDQRQLAVVVKGVSIRVRARHRHPRQPEAEWKDMPQLDARELWSLWPEDGDHKPQLPLSLPKVSTC